MLTEMDRPRAQELVDHAWNAVSPLLELNQKEMNFTSRLQEGDLYPGLLFPDDPEMASFLQKHPALLWKAKNARQHAQCQRSKQSDRDGKKAR
jgi:hypothetical protein